MDEKLINALAKAVKAEVEELGNNTFLLRLRGMLLTCVLSKDGIHYQGLWPEGKPPLDSGERPGIITELVEKTPGLFRKHGVKRMTLLCVPGMEDAFKGIGYEPVSGDERWLTDKWLEAHTVHGDWHGKLMVHPLVANSRHEQYTAWKRGEAKEPDWRA